MYTWILILFVCLLPLFFGVFCDGLVVLLSVHVRWRAGRRRHLVQDAADVSGHVHRALLVHLDKGVSLRRGRGGGRRQSAARQKLSTAALTAPEWQGLTSSSLYFGLLDSSFVRLRGQRQQREGKGAVPSLDQQRAQQTAGTANSVGRVERSPHVDKGDELGGEASLLRVAELRRVAPHHLSQLIEHTVPLGVGEATSGQLVLGKRHTHTGLVSNPLLSYAPLSLDVVFNSSVIKLL